MQYVTTPLSCLWNAATGIGVGVCYRQSAPHLLLWVSLVQGIILGNEVATQFAHCHIIQCLAVLAVAVPYPAAYILFKQSVFGCREIPCKQCLSCFYSGNFVASSIFIKHLSLNFFAIWHRIFLKKITFAFAYRLQKPDMGYVGGCNILLKSVY